MTRVQLLQSVIGSTLIMLLVIGCGGTSSVQPQPGATFSGPMEISTSGMGSNVTVDGGEIEFTVTEDGAAIASTSFWLINAVCTNDLKNRRIEGAWSMGFSNVPPTPIKNGNFEQERGDIKIKGNFTSATEANGTIEISSEEEDMVKGQYFTCDFGTWNWSAIIR